MNKRYIAKAFNEAKIGEWTTITTDKIKLTNGFFESEEESREEINTYVDQYINFFLTKAVQKKIIGLKVLVNWPSDNTPFKPIARRMEVFRVSAKKYILLLHVQ